MLRRVQQRLHHLDALRAAAMLLGIVLHASLAYTGGPWMVRDEGHWTFAVANFAIHGFRMPLFFLLSGFFTALLWKRHGIGGMLRNRAARIALPLVLALFTIVPLIWIVAIVAGAEQGGEDAPPAGDGAAPPHPLAIMAWMALRFPLFGHLWFLWYLCWLVLGFALVAWFAKRTPLAARLGRLTRPSAATRLFLSSAGALVWLVPITAVSFACMDWTRAEPGFGPDTSAALVPMPGILLHYAIFFAAGALFHEIPDALDGFSRRWIIAAVAALAIFPIATSFAYGAPWTRAILPSALFHSVLAWTGQALYAWLMCIACIGLFARFASEERPAVRYLADSAYWLYLVHLPLVVAGQAMLKPLDWPSALKFAVLTVASTVLLLASYHWCVRRTWIGVLLNGRRAVRGGPSS